MIVADDQLIEFETGELAKEKGYEGDKTIKYGWYYDGESTYFSYKHRNILIPQPTQSSLQKWLREEKCVNVFVVPALKENHYEWLIIDNDENIIEADECFVKFEKALEIGLKTALELI